MALKLEELKIGESYVLMDQINTVDHIGAKNVTYHYDNDVNKEGHVPIEHALNHWSLKPKPKKVIELAGFISKRGIFVECIVDSKEQQDRTDWGYTRISTRTVECE